MITFFGTEMNPWTGSEKSLKRWLEDTRGGQKGAEERHWEGEGAAPTLPPVVG